MELSLRHPPSAILYSHSMIRAARGKELRVPSHRRPPCRCRGLRNTKPFRCQSPRGDTRGARLRAGLRFRGASCRPRRRWKCPSRESPHKPGGLARWRLRGASAPPCRSLRPARSRQSVDQTRACRRARAHPSWRSRQSQTGRGSSPRRPRGRLQDRRPRAPSRRSRRRAGNWRTRRPRCSRHLSNQTDCRCARRWC